jgi:hypothetical protein
MNILVPFFTRLELILMHPRFTPVCFLAFIRIRFVLIVFVPVEPGSDALWYFNRASTLAEQGTYSENGLPTAFWPVGYPAFLALLFAFTGTHLAVAQFANLFLAACTFWLLFRFVQAVFENDLAARLSVLLLTLYPNNAAYVPQILSETLYTFLLLFASVLLVTRRSAPIFILVGITLGLATLVKTQTLLLAPIIVTIAFLKDWTISAAKPAILRAAAIFVLMLAVVTPWTLRNYSIFGDFILVSTNGGVTLLSGNNPSVVGDYRNDYSEADPLFKQAGFSTANQVAADKHARRLAQQWILENPGDFIGLIPKKFFRFWGPDGEGEWGYQRGTSWYDQEARWFRLVRVINQTYYFLLLTGFTIAIWRLLRTPAMPKLYLGMAIAIYFTFVSLVFSGQSRYHFPVMPFVLAYVAWIGSGALRPNRLREIHGGRTK